MATTNPFGTSVTAPTPPAPEEPTASGRRTVVMAVAAGVAALGVLGGAAALVLGGDDDAELAAVPPAAVQPVPSAAPSAAPTVSAPLPTAAVQGRNIFVPLVGGRGDAGAEGGAVADGAAVADGGAAVEEGGAAQGAVVAPATADPGAAAAEQRVRELQAQIADLTQQLVVAGADGSALTAQVATLTKERDDLFATNAGLATTVADAEALEAGRRIVEFVSVRPDLTGSPLEVRVGGDPVATLDLEPAPPGGTDQVDNFVVLGTTGAQEPVVLTYRSVDTSGGPTTVTVQVGSSTYRVSEGGVLVFSIV